VLLAVLQPPKKIAPVGIYPSSNQSKLLLTHFQYIEVSLHQKSQSAQIVLLPFAILSMLLSKQSAHLPVEIVEKCFIHLLSQVPPSDLVSLCLISKSLKFAGYRTLLHSVKLVDEQNWATNESSTKIYSFADLLAKHSYLALYVKELEIIYRLQYRGRMRLTYSSFDWTPTVAACQNLLHLKLLRQPSATEQLICDRTLPSALSSLTISDSTLSRVQDVLLLAPRLSRLDMHRVQDERYYRHGTTDSKSTFPHSKLSHIGFMCSKLDVHAKIAFCRAAYGDLTSLALDIADHWGSDDPNSLILQELGSQLTSFTIAAPTYQDQAEHSKDVSMPSKQG